MITHWLSFAGDEGFRGVVLIDGCSTSEEAYAKVTAAGLNPGGEVAIFGYSDKELAPEHVAPERTMPRMRLLDRDYLKERGHISMKEMSPKEAQTIENHADIICEDCNNGHCESHS